MVEPVSRPSSTTNSTLSSLADFKISKHVIFYILIYVLIWFSIWHLSLEGFEYYNVHSQLDKGLIFVALSSIAIGIAYFVR